MEKDNIYHKPRRRKKSRGNCVILPQISKSLLKSRTIMFSMQSSKSICYILRLYREISIKIFFKIAKKIFMLKINKLAFLVKITYTITTFTK